MLGLLDLVRIGARAVSRYTGMVLALWVTQALVTGAAIVGIAQTLAAALADRPLLDAAVDGDLVALLELMSALPELLWASIWTIVAIVLLWVVASWFLAGGVIAVLGERPEGRAASSTRAKSTTVPATTHSRSPGARPRPRLSATSGSVSANSMRDAAQSAPMPKAMIAGM